MSVRDTFSPDANPLPSPWVNMLTGGAAQAFSGVCFASATPALYRYSGLGLVDYHAKIKLVTALPGGVLVRASGTAGSANDSGYFVYWDSANVKIYKRVNGTNTLLKDCGAVSFAINDTLEARVVGTGSGSITISAYKNNTFIDSTLNDTTVYNTGDPGLYLNGYQGDDFDVTDLAVAGGSAVPVFMNQYRQRRA